MYERPGQVNPAKRPRAGGPGKTVVASTAAVVRTSNQVATARYRRQADGFAAHADYTFARRAGTVRTCGARRADFVRLTNVCRSRSRSAALKNPVSTTRLRRRMRP